MQHRRRAARAALRLAATAALALAALVPATAALHPASATADVTGGASGDDRGVHLVIDRRGTLHQQRAAGNGCTKTYVPVALSPGDRGVRLPAGTTLPPRPGPTYRAYLEYCGGALRRVVWVDPTRAGGGGGRATNDRLVKDLPFPGVTIRAEPGHRGLAGMATTFRLDGYEHGPVREALTGWGLTLTVEGTPLAVRWDAGDGTPPVIVPLGPDGHATFVHTYERRSPAGGFPVRAALTLAVRWRPGDGGWRDLPAVERATQLPYPVATSRARLVSPR